MIIEIPDDKINDQQFESMMVLIEHVRRARWCNAWVRSDGVEYPYELDWLKHAEVHLPLSAERLKDEFNGNKWKLFRKQIWLKTHGPEPVEGE